MIRFIDLHGQLYLPVENPTNEFAFYDTIHDVFVSFSGSCRWDCKKCFIESFKHNEEEETDEFRTRFNGQIDRFLNKIPEKYHKDCEVE